MHIALFKLKKKNWTTVSKSSHNRMAALFKHC